jgi:Protein of unknown function (DUF1488)
LYFFFGPQFLASRDDLRFALLIQGEGLKMSVQSAGWYMDDGPPSWRPETKAFSFYLRKLGHDQVMCVVSIDALEGAVQLNDLSETILSRIFDAHRQMIELRAAQKLNAGLFEPMVPCW